MFTYAERYIGLRIGNQGTQRIIQVQGHAFKIVLANNRMDP
jgi:hypothetical protein